MTSPNFNPLVVMPGVSPQNSGVANLKSFLYFVIVVAVGFAAAFFMQGYFGTLMF